MTKLLPVITYRAWSKINDILKYSLKDSMLYSVDSGGCNGYSFKLDILDKKHKIQLDSYKIKPTILNSPININHYVYIDPISELYLYSTEIDFINDDYDQQIFQSQFIFNVDKDVMSSCGCGTSFNIK